eukprot:2950611-Prymnesium_polylepis.3
MMIQPDSTFSATAYTPGTYSRYQASAITWMTFCHEVGHNLGLHHAGATKTTGIWEEYQDDALMGYQRSWRAADFTAIA